MSAPNESQNKPADLSALQSLNFGPSWATSSEPRQPKPPRETRDFTDARAGRRFGEKRPDRRGFDRGPRERGEDGGRGENRRPFRERGERNDRGERGFRGERGDRGGNARRQPRPQLVADVVFYPEEKPFAVLTKAVKASMRTYELFEIAHLILEKSDRFVVVCKPLPKAEDETAALYQSVPDHLPFLSEADAVAHVLKQHLEQFFTAEEIEIEPPKGNFQMVSKCGFSGELLAPPNYHGYQQILREHHAARLPRMAFEKFTSRIESVRDEAQVAAWVERMKKTTRYTLKEPKEGEPTVFESLEAARHFLLAHRKDKVVRASTQVRFSGKLIETMPNGPLRAGIEHELAFQRQFPLNTANAIRGRLRKIGFSLYKKGAKGIAYVSSVRRKFRTPDTVFADSIQKVFDFIEKHPNAKVADLPEKMLGIVPAPVTTPLSTVEAPAPVVEEAPSSGETEKAAPAEETAEAAVESVPAEETSIAETAVSEVLATAEEIPVEAAAPATESVAAKKSESAPVDLSNPAVLELMNTVRWLVSEGYVTEYSDGRLFATPVMTEAQARAAKAEEGGAEEAATTTAEEIAEALGVENLPVETAEEKSAPTESSVAKAATPVAAETAEENSVEEAESPKEEPPVQG